MSSPDFPYDHLVDLSEAAKAQLSVIVAERKRRLEQEAAQENQSTSGPAKVIPVGGKIKLPSDKKIAAKPSQAWVDQERREYIRLIRDGHADRVEAMIRGVSREIEVGRKTDRFSDAARLLTGEFDKFSKEFLRKKELLARIEERLGPLRRLVAAQPKVDEIQDAFGHDRLTAEKMARLLQDTSTLRDDLIDVACQLLDLWDRIDEQVRADEKLEEHLRAQISRALENVRAKERLRFEVRLERSLREAQLQQRLDVLRKFERLLADATPEGRARRKEKLLGEGRAYLQAGDFPQAIAILEKVYRLARADDAVVLDLAKAYMENGQLEHAINILTKFLQSGDSVSALLALARCVEKAGRVGEALSVYDRAIALRPNDLNVRVAHCQALARCGRTDEAFRRLLELHARHPRAPQVALALARACVSGGEPLKAREILVRLTESNPDCVEGWAELADLYWEARQLDDAECACHRLLQLDAGNLGALIRLADLERQRGDFRSAEEHYRAAEKVDADSCSVHIGLGIVLRETGRPADAASELERAIALNPEHGEAYHHLGLACLLAGDSVRAAAAMEQAVCFGFVAS
jgi:predicted Zn-dependent protease